MPFESKRPEEEYGAKKKRLAEQNTDVVRPIGRVSKEVIKKASGRKKKYSPRKMVGEINRYFKWCEDKDEIPSIKGMMLYLEMYPDSFYKYMEYPDYRDIMENARLVIVEWAERDVYNTKGMAAGKIQYMKNIHSWADKIEQTSTVTQTVMTVDQARSKLESLAPKLLEILKNNNLLNQLALPATEAEVIEK